MWSLPNGDRDLQPWFMIWFLFMGALFPILAEPNDP
jgi:hypothetical protein